MSRKLADKYSSIAHRQILGDVLATQMAKAIEDAYMLAYDKTKFTPKEINCIRNKHYVFYARAGRRLVFWYLKNHFKDEPVITNQVILDALCVPEENVLRRIWADLKENPQKPDHVKSQFYEKRITQ